MSVRIHGYLVSTWTRTVCMTCIEKGLHHTVVPVAYRSTEHAALHPFRRMPILEVGEARIIETLAITGYLDEAFPGPRLTPADVAGRANMRMWMAICGDYLFRDVVRGIPRDRPANDHELTTARTALERAESLVPESPYLAGGSLTLADLYLAPSCPTAVRRRPSCSTALGASRRGPSASTAARASSSPGTRHPAGRRLRRPATRCRRRRPAGATR